MSVAQSTRAGSSTTVKGGRGSPARRRGRMFIPFVGPALAFYTVLFIVPTVIAVWISLHKWAGSGPMQWRGLSNYVALYHDTLFRRSLLNTLELLVIVGVVMFILSFVMSLVLRDMAGKKIARAVIFFPHMINALVFGAVIGFMFNPGGLVNSLLQAIGVNSPPQWLSPDNLFPLIMAAMLFITTGYYTTILMAGVDRIPPYFYEDCAMAGANAWQRLRYVIIPLTWDVFGVCAVLWTISSIKIFEIIWIFGGSNGVGQPPTQSWTTAVYTYATAFGGQSIPAYGAGTAAAVVSLILVAVLVVLLRRAMRRDVIEF
ncbi:carbohydrate ABC transporter permease [Leekyejoonella antrihumi]|uniref:Sugar ABC transporter permease n=1 Tax=Leekyejoonella antrihumi TaxID=1660198 RepID=A0A563DV58_9MICO|nr:sugar ABC transporter permease [Leekyejoonella antrihumi]TWP34125.1 sugar ABC transporter permease [Leekyejoonella antrihumi]